MQKDNLHLTSSQTQLTQTKSHGKVKATHWTCSDEIIKDPNKDACFTTDKQLLRYWSTVATHRDRRQGSGERSPTWRFCASINETTVVAFTSSMENTDNGKTEINLDDQFEMIRQCAPTRMTTRPLSQGPQHESVVSLVPAGATPGSAMNKQRKLHWFR